MRGSIFEVQTENGRRRTQRRSPAGGFTLVELVVVIVLAAILAIALVPRTPTKGGLSLSGQAEQLASDLRYVQTLSMTRGRRYCLNLTTTGYSMTTNDCSTTAGVEHPAGLSFPVVLDGVSLSWTNLPNNLVTFSGKGVPYSDAAATSALSANAVISLSGSDGTRHVCITPETGRVFVDTDTDCL